MSTNEINNLEDMIDSRDVIARIEYLESEHESAREALELAADDLEDLASDPTPCPETLAAAQTAYDSARAALQTFETDYLPEMLALRELASECEGYVADWVHGEALIRDSYFREYAMQLADDIGAVPSDAQWPNTCIDWDQAARELQMDYTSISFDGVDYWVR